MSTFVDTSAFLAICKFEDERHEQAAAAWKQLALDQEIIVTTNYVVVETTALLHSRYGVDAVRVFVESILPIVLVEWIGIDIHASALNVVLASSGKRSPSLVDCVSFEIIRKSGIDRAFAYDRHFEEQGFVLLGQ